VKTRKSKHKFVIQFTICSWGFVDNTGKSAWKSPLQSTAMKSCTLLILMINKELHYISEKNNLWQEENSEF